MKKSAVISLIFIYALATMGFSLKEFYCCGKLRTVSITIADDGTSKCNKGDDSKDGCCKSKFQYFKIRDNHVVADQIINPAAYFSDLHLSIPYFQNISFASPDSVITYRSNAPPLYSGIPVYISNCVFRI